MPPRSLFLVSVCVLSLLSISVFSAPKRHKRRAAAPLAKRLLERAEGPVALTLESVDLVESAVVVTITGVTRAIDARFFTFHDDRDRHFIALDARCEAAIAPLDSDDQDEAAPKPRAHSAHAPAQRHDLIRCTLAFPSPYALAHVRALTVRIGQREIPAPDAEVIARFQAAQASIKLTVPKPADRSPSLLRMRLPDGGTSDPEDDTEE